MNLKDKLKEISFQMMLNETSKLQAENIRSLSLKTENNCDAYSTEKGCQRSLIIKDRKGYELSLAFNELLLQNGMTHNAFIEGPDAANIAAENMLYKYGLRYPISWHSDYQDKYGLHFVYDYSDKIQENHIKFLLEVKKLLKDKKIDEFVYERLILAGEYYKEHHNLLSKHFNGEHIKSSSFKK